MPFLLYVGRNDENVGRTSAKGYGIRRSGRKVIARWGEVETVGARGGTFHWRNPESPGRTKVWSFRTVAQAEAEKKRRIRRKEADGYDVLPPGKPIRAPRRT